MNTSAPILEEDRQILKDLGYDSGDVAGSGIIGTVFKGVCNAKSAKFYQISENELNSYANYRTIRDETGVWVEVPLYGRKCAIKRLDPQQTQHLTDSLQEARILINLKHPNIVEVFNVLTTPSGHKYIITEFANAGSLEKLEQEFSSKSRLQEWEVRNFMEEILSGLKYLHDRQIAHNDIHSGNIMLHKPDHSRPWFRQIKLIDFGVAKAEGEDEDNEYLMFMGVDYGFDIRRLGNVFKRMLDMSLIPDPSIDTQLKTIADRMVKSNYSTVDQLLGEIKPILESMQKSRLHIEPIPQQSGSKWKFWKRR